MFEQTAKGLHTFCRAGWLERHVGLDHFVHGDGVEIDMQNIAAERRMLHFLHEREPAGLFALNLELDKNVFAGSVTEHQSDVALRDLQAPRACPCRRK